MNKLHFRNIRVNLGNYEWGENFFELSGELDLSGEIALVE